MLEVNYYIWLQMALGEGAIVSDKLSYFGSPKGIFKATELDLRLSGLFTSKQVYNLKHTDIGLSYKIISECAVNGIDIITLNDPLYPDNFKMLDKAPLVLYVLGDVSCLNSQIPISIVGTRKAAANTISATQVLASTLSRCGMTIVSGGALGVDAAAHTGAICAHGKTVAILGGGIACGYLAKNEELRRAIAQNGALISESPPYKKPFKGSFPVRNRLIAAISVGTIVAEANVKSGSLITSKCANDFGRDVFAIPNDNMGTSNLGVAQLLEDGAIPVRNANAVLDEYNVIYSNIIEMAIKANGVTEAELQADITNVNSLMTLPKSCASKEFSDRTTFKIKRELIDSASLIAKRVYACFDMESLSINDIANNTVLPINVVMGAITELEILGYIELLPNAKYILKQEG